MKFGDMMTKCPVCHGEGWTTISGRPRIDGDIDKGDDCEICGGTGFTDIEPRTVLRRIDDLERSIRNLRYDCFVSMMLSIVLFVIAIAVVIAK